ncbi:MAG: efflux RND transporter periplasmic adaptor subunit [Panacagrimonas sp.]
MNRETLLASPNRPSLPGSRGRARPGIISLTLATLVLAVACSAPSPPAPTPPEVSAAKVIQKKIKDWDEFTGRLEAVEHVEIRPRVSGYIDSVNFTEGRIVAKDELLFVIDPRPYQADYDRAAAELARSRTALKLSSLELQRVQKMRDTGAVSQEELDQRESALAQAEANVAGAKAAVDAASLNLSFTRVSSPIDGRIGRAEITRGNLVSGGATGGTLLTTVVSIDPIYLYFEADEQSFLGYARKVRQGTLPSSREVQNPLELGLADEPGFPHPGFIDFVDNQLNPDTGTIRGRGVFANKDRLLTPGMFGRVRMLASGDYDAIMVDDRAIGTDQSQTFVLVIDADSELVYRPVKLGRLVDGLRVIREGLAANETIVVNGLQRVRPGMPVSPKLVAMEPAPATLPVVAADGTRP